MRTVSTVIHSFSDFPPRSCSDLFFAVLDLEKHLELEHEVERKNYMKASNNFHTVLKVTLFPEEYDGKFGLRD